MPPEEASSPAPPGPHCSDTAQQTSRPDTEQCLPQLLHGGVLGLSLSCLQQPGLLHQHPSVPATYFPQQLSAPQQRVQQEQQQPPLSLVMSQQPDSVCHQSSPVKRHNRSNQASIVGSGQGRTAIGVCNEHSQAHCVQRGPTADEAQPLEAPPEAVSAATACSPLKGSSAWPPPSPSPKKAVCSQNRRPVKVNSVSQVVPLQRHADVMALHQRLR